MVTLAKRMVLTNHMKAFTLSLSLPLFLHVRTLDAYAPHTLSLPPFSTKIAPLTSLHPHTHFLFLSLQKPFICAS
jgi:hypothetical protein